MGGGGRRGLRLRRPARGDAASAPATSASTTSDARRVIMGFRNVDRELDERAHAVAGAALRRLRVVGRRAGGSRDVEVRPRRVAGELLAGRGRRSACPRRRPTRRCAGRRSRSRGCGGSRRAAAGARRARPRAPRPRCTCATHASSLPISPAILSPSAIVTAPVSVARSMIASAPSSLASDSASARIRRPSASVLSTSTVLPLRIVSTSPGRIAAPLGMFSTSGT